MTFFIFIFLAGGGGHFNQIFLSLFLVFFCAVNQFNYIGLWIERTAKEEL